jgi:hypothetical protein
VVCHDLSYCLSSDAKTQSKQRKQSDGANAPSSVPAAVPSSKPCKHYALGRCNRGDACLFSHDVPPTQTASVVDEGER